MRTMLMSTAAIGLVATLLTAPPKRIVCAERFVTTGFAKANACLVDIAPTCTNTIVTIIGTTCTDRV